MVVIFVDMAFPFSYVRKRILLVRNANSLAMLIILYGSSKVNR